MSLVLYSGKKVFTFQGVILCHTSLFYAEFWKFYNQDDLMILCQSGIPDMQTYIVLHRQVQNKVEKSDVVT